MTRVSKPNNTEEVLDVMRKYNIEKGFGCTITQLQYMAEICFLSFEAKGWVGSKYWPALAKKWVLNNRTDFGKKTPFIVTKPKAKGKTTREQIMEEGNA